MFGPSDQKEFERGLKTVFVLSGLGIAAIGYFAISAIVWIFRHLHWS